MTIRSSLLTWASVADGGHRWLVLVCLWRPVRGLIFLLALLLVSRAATSSWWHARGGPSPFQLCPWQMRFFW